MVEFMQHLEEARGHLTPAERRVAQYVERNLSQVAFQTLNQVSDATGVSEASVLRFVRKLGFPSFTNLQQLLQKEVQRRYSLGGELERSLPHDGTTDAIMATYWKDQQNLKATYENLDREQYHAAVDRLVGARKVGIVGFRASAAPATYLSLIMNFARPGVTQLRLDHDNLFDQLLDFDERDVIVALSFARPAQRTLKVVGWAKERSVPLIAITDSRLSPLGLLVRDALIVGTEGTFFHSYTAVMSLCTALLSGVGGKLHTSAQERIARLERVNQEEEILH